jgi:hypothetical protein
MSNQYRFKKFDSLITACRKHISIHSNLRNSIIKLICVIEDSELKLNIKFGTVCIEKTYNLMNLIIRFCNIHLFRCDEVNYVRKSLEINTYLEDLCSSLDSIKISRNTTKNALLKHINEILYRFSYNIQDIVLKNMEDTKKNTEGTIVPELDSVESEDDTSLVKNIINYFDNEFEYAKDDIYKFIDES